MFVEGSGSESSSDSIDLVSSLCLVWCVSTLFFGVCFSVFFVLIFGVGWGSSSVSLGRRSFDMRVDSSSLILLLVFVFSGRLIFRGVTNGSGGVVVVVFLYVFFGGSCAGGGSFGFCVVFCIFSL